MIDNRLGTEQGTTKKIDTHLCFHRVYLLLKVLFIMEVSLVAWLAYWLIVLSWGHQAQLHSFGTSLGWGTWLTSVGGTKWSAMDLALSGGCTLTCAWVCLGSSSRQTCFWVGPVPFFVCIPFIQHLSSLREKDIHVVSFSSQRAQESTFNTVASLHYVLYWVPSSRNIPQEPMWPQILFPIFLPLSRL